MIDANTPGSVIAVEVKTNDPFVPSLKLNGVLPPIAPGGVRVMNANITAPGGSENLYLKCTYELTFDSASRLQQIEQPVL
jgi:hypothetical protein